MFRRHPLPDRLQAELQRYIDAHYRPQPEKRRAAPFFAGARSRLAEEDELCLGRIDAPLSAQPAEAAVSDTASLAFALQVDEPFSLKLLRLIDQKGLDDVACYKKAGVSRQTWYKILNESGYKPNKKTVLSFAFALELTLEETQTLLSSVGFVLSQSSLFDVILMYCLSHGLYDAETIDALLFQHDQETLFSRA